MTTIFLSSMYFTKGHTNLPREAIGPKGVSVPVFLRKPIATCDFQGGSRHPVPPLDLPMFQTRTRTVATLHVDIGI